MRRHSGHAVRWVFVLVFAVFAWAVPAQGQAIEEGFPAKRVFQDEPALSPPPLPEECDAFAIPDEFGEGCREGSEARMPETFGGIAQGTAGFPDGPSGPVLRAAPFIECPAAVFIEEMETGSIDCEVRDEAGEEHIDYYWEPAGGAPQGYLDAPRLIGEDRLVPSIVAPSSPSYATLESFLSEEATLRYRYRLTALSRVTGLSSQEEVEVFVLLRRPSVYCPLEYEVPAGSEVVLSCEGADPLSFRMDYEEGSSVSWEWEGLWGASASLLSGADTPSPSFRAPLGGSGETYDYVASMTTTSSGVPRTARRRVSVRVVEGDAEASGSLSPSSSTPSVTCTDYEVYATAPNFYMDCSWPNPLNRVRWLRWTPLGATPDLSMFLRGDNAKKLDENRPLFLAGQVYHHWTRMQGPVTYEYKVSLIEVGFREKLEIASDTVTVTILDHPDLLECTTEYEAYEGDPDFKIDCRRLDGGRFRPVTPSIVWTLGPWTFRARPWRRFWHMEFLSTKKELDPIFSVPKSISETVDIAYFVYEVCIYFDSVPSGYPNIPPYTRVESHLITIKVKNKTNIKVACTHPDAVYEGSPDVALSCSARGGPEGAAYAYAWTARGSTQDTGLLSATDVSSPTFDVPDNVARDEKHEYLLTVSEPNMQNATAEVTVTVLDKQGVLSCADPDPVYEGSADIPLSCTATGVPTNSSPAYVWSALGSTRSTSRLSATNVASPTFDVPQDIDRDETYEYLLTVFLEHKVYLRGKIKVTVLNKRSIYVQCRSTYEGYEGSADIVFDCRARGAPAGSDYKYVWEPSRRTPDTSLLSATDVLNPTFSFPDDVSKTTHYNYKVTASAEHAEDGRATVTVSVWPAAYDISVACERPAPAYEGSGSIALQCSSSGSPDGYLYSYVWRARGSTADVSLLSAANVSSPTFAVPDDVHQTTTYEYVVRSSALHSRDGVAEVAVTVLDRPAVVASCAAPGSVYEGSPDVALSCTTTGAPEGSTYSYAWEARGSTADTGLLSAADVLSPTFRVPDAVDQDETYEYRLRVTAAHGETATANVTVTVLDRSALVASCASPGSVYEGSEDVALSCTATGAPEGSTYSYAWRAMGSTADTGLLSAANVLSPTFSVPKAVRRTTRYEYLLTVSAANAESGEAEVAVTVLDRPAVVASCASPDSVYEGSEDVALSCTATGAPEGSTYSYAWSAMGTTPSGMLSATNTSSPMFYVPGDVEETTRYEYSIGVTATGAEAGSAQVTVTVMDEGALALTCAAPAPVYEGSPDVALSCSASGAPDGSAYEYAWEARGATADTDLLSAADIASPLFDVPDQVTADETYEYRVTVSAENADDATADVTVTVLDRGASPPPPVPVALALTCANPAPVYEGSPDVALSCAASGAPEGSAFEYVWEARGSTADTDLLSAADTSSPTFMTPAAVDVTTRYEYRVTVSADNAEPASAEVTVTVLNKGALALVCDNPASVYEGSPDVALSCEASGAPEGSTYEYVWEARGATANTDLLSAADIASPMFAVPDEVSQTMRYEYGVTASADNAEDATAEVTVTVLDRPEPPSPPTTPPSPPVAALTLTCANPAPVYEGAPDVALSCEASGAPEGSAYEYAWEARGAAADTDLLSAADVSSPTFAVPDEVSQTTRYEYGVTASADNAEDATAEVTVTVLDRPEPPSPPTTPPSPPVAALTLTCADPAPVYEGSPDVALSCEASGAPEGSAFEYVWESRGAAADTDLLSAADIASPTFAVPDEVSQTTRYEYRVTASAENAEDATADVIVTVLDRPESPAPPPAVAFSADPTSIGVRASASALRFGAQSADTEVSLDPLTDQITTRVSGPHHAGRMTLAAADDLSLGENGEAALSIELVTPAALRREGSSETLALAPRWSYAASCDQQASESIGGSFMQATLSESDCRLLLFGGDLDLTEASPGRYSGNIEVVLRTSAGEETRSVEAQVTVVPAARVITVGPGGVRFDASRKVPSALTEEQNLSIYPDVAFLTRDKPSGAFELSNPSLMPLEVSVSARFGYAEATEDGREIVVEDAAASPLGDLSEIVDIYPSILTLTPGEQRVVRYGIREEALASMQRSAQRAMEHKGYAAFFDVSSSPRQYARADQLPEDASEGRTAHVTMRMPGAYAPDASVPRLRAELLSLSAGASPSATFLVETEDFPFAGEAVAYDREGRELGRSETLIYTRSRVRVSLERLPEDETVFLRFAPRGSGRLSAPVSVPWSAQGQNGAQDGARDSARDGLRDIGAAAQDGGTPTPDVALAEKP